MGQDCFPEEISLSLMGLARVQCGGVGEGWAAGVRVCLVEWPLCSPFPEASAVYASSPLLVCPEAAGPSAASPRASSWTQQWSYRTKSKNIQSNRKTIGAKVIVLVPGGGHLISKSIK